ncbi:hypothetical protein TRIUR3_13487 [Triticum urartu]|uniref:Knottins-like domain-containing protein n=1 Tax=Triticum urartu TaxID=4572 RepID=M7YYA5_TRIUA|nr:hypothetical protein TRIUR3_13487 [Triticum urartu]
MGVLKVRSLLCLLFIMLILLVPGSDAKTCKEASESYTKDCSDDPCVSACHKEGFVDGKCEMLWARPVILRCFYISNSC